MWNNTSRNGQQVSAKSVEYKGKMKSKMQVDRQSINFEELISSTNENADELCNLAEPKEVTERRRDEIEKRKEVSLHKI